MRESQHRLAEELTQLIHGTAGLHTHSERAEIFFGAEIDQMSDSQLGDIFADVPSKELPRACKARGSTSSMPWSSRAWPKTRAMPAERWAGNGPLRQQSPRPQESPSSLGPHNWPANR